MWREVDEFYDGEEYIRVARCPYCGFEVNLRKDQHPPKFCPSCKMMVGSFVREEPY